MDTNATIKTPAGTFTGCIAVKITNEFSTLHEYFKSGVGMVKREFSSEGAIVTSELAKYSIK